MQSVVGALILSVSAAAAADEIVISDDGRQIQLNGDGTWVQLSRDRFATNGAGQRIRMKADGTWTVLSSSNVTADESRTGYTPIEVASELTLHLAKVEILRRKIKRAKAIHAQTRTIYYIEILNDSSRSIDIAQPLKPMLAARSSTGGEFEIVAVDVERLTIAPKERVQIRVEAEGAPQWFGVKYMQLDVAAGALGNAQRRVLSKSMDEVEKRVVEQL